MIECTRLSRADGHVFAGIKLIRDPVDGDAIDFQDETPDIESEALRAELRGPQASTPVRNYIRIRSVTRFVLNTEMPIYDP